MLDIPYLQNNYQLAPLTQQKKELEDRMAVAHQTGDDMSFLSSELNYLSNRHKLYTQLNSLIEQYKQAEQLETSEDAELQELAIAELRSIPEMINGIVEQIDEIEIAKELADPDDSRSVIIEIRAGAGGEEASLFGADLFRMYTNYATSQGWSVELIDASLSESGGYKEVVGHIKGEGVYEKLKYESGVHRVQRIPVTESGGRIHTSTASVAILPEAKEIEIDIKPEDLKIEIMRASGAGGQKVNKTSSAIRITHLPTGIVVSCQETKVQAQNKEKAMQILNARLYEQKRQEMQDERSGMRSSQIGGAKRSEKIRTYNYPQSRITDHRIKTSWHDLEGILNGNIDEMLEDLHREITSLQLLEIKKQRIKEQGKSN